MEKMFQRKTENIFHKYSNFEVNLNQIRIIFF